MLAIAVLFLVSKSLLVTNEYLALLVRNGAGLVWTDAIYPLSDYLQRAKCQAIYLNDWGMFNNLRLLNRGALPLRDGFDPLSKAFLDNDDRRIVLDRISEKGAVFVAHTAGSELFKGVNANLLVLAGGGGYQRQMLSEIADRNGRTIFEVFRFTPVPR